MRNLNPDEIFDQVVAIDHHRAYFNRPLSNIVFMGMGEPLMNYKCTRAIEKITSPTALGCLPNGLVSISGIPKLIHKMADDAVQSIWPFHSILNTINPHQLCHLHVTPG